MDLIASAVMTRQVKTVGPEMLVPDLEERLHKDRLTGYPVVATEARRVVGVVSRADLIRHLSLERSIIELAADYYGKSIDTDEIDWVATNTGRGVEHLKVRDVMSTHLIQVEPDASLHHVADLMTRENVHRVLVTHNDELLGVITTFDFVKLYSQSKISADAAPFAGTCDF